jgi:5,10-methylene-tetrahydrofolate dehydrogenase/methenyl tetrahydrofolate cyclohydrolase
MQRGIIPVNQFFELEYRYYEKDLNYKYFNRRFEIYLIGKKGAQKIYIHRASNVAKKLYFGVTTLNWNEIKDNFLAAIIAEIGDTYKSDAKKAVVSLLSPKL